MIDGFYTFDKPLGFTSFDVVARVRRGLDVKGVGHLGTLDPLATGVLVCAVGEATKLIEYFMKADKVYESTAELGKISDTYDAEGRITVVTESPSVQEEAIRALLPVFTGDIQQVPPAFSALKIKGQRAYDLARKGEVVVLPPRPVQIHALTLLDFTSPFFRLSVHCGSGTYIRSLVHDLGQRLGCGAILTQLCRTRLGGFDLFGALSLSQTPEEWILGRLSLEAAVAGWPRFILNEAQHRALQLGQRVVGVVDFPSLDAAVPVAGFYNDRLVSLLTRDENGSVKVVKNFVIH